MSLAGQWIARYQGSNTGTLVLDLDEFDDHFAGTAVGWDDNPAYPNALVRIHTSTKSDVQHLHQVPLSPLDRRGMILTPDQIQQVATNGVTMPTSLDIDLELAEGELKASWRSSIGTTGNTTARTSKARGGLPSDLQPMQDVSEWGRFKELVNGLPKRRYIFRGQSHNRWRLRTSFHRTGRADLERYAKLDVNELLKIFSALTHHQFSLDDHLQFAAILHLAQHHGYPTPLLDWSWSPYVAAFFAFRNVEAGIQDSQKVRIFKLDCAEWNKLPRADKIFPFYPHATIIDPLAFENPRAIPQQSISVVSNVDDIEGHITQVEAIHKRPYLEVFDLPARDRERVMTELALMGVTAGAMFPGMDGACESLKERNFSTRATPIVVS